MHIKKLISLIIISVFAISLLSACGSSGSSEPAADTPETVAPTTPAATEAQKELDSQELVDIIEADMGLSLAYISEIHVSLLDADDNFTVTFKANDKDCTYVINGYTGEIVSKDIPEGAKDNAEKDPMEAAINAAMNSLEGYNGGAESIKVSQEGTTITVEFDWNGEHHTFHYDMNTESLID